MSRVRAMMIYVDGTDLLTHFADQGDPIAAEDDRDRSRGNLTRWLGRYCEVRDCDAVLVFDEGEPGEVLPPTERFGRVKVINVPYGAEAYTEIGGPANRSAAKERTLVVTADHRLASVLERGKARVLSPADFVARASKLMGRADEAVPDEPDEKFTGLTDEEIGFWLRFFGDDR